MFMTVGDADTFWHPQPFSTVTLEFRRLTEVVPRLTAVTIFSTVMFELAGLMNRDFCTPCSQCRSPWHVIAWSRAVIPTSSLRTTMSSVSSTFAGGCSSAIKPTVARFRQARRHSRRVAELGPLTLCRLPWHFIAWCGGWDSDVIAENQHKFFKFIPASH